MKQISKQYFRVKRRFEDFTFVYYLYLAWVLLAFLGVGTLAIKPTIQNILNKADTIRELEQINQNLETNIYTVGRYQNVILDDDAMLAGIGTAMPETPDVEQFVELMEKAASSAGFSLSRLNARSGASQEDGSIQVTVSFKGFGNISQLVENIENIKRLTVVNDFSYRIDSHSSIKGDALISMDITIFTSGGIK